MGFPSKHPPEYFPEDDHPVEGDEGDHYGEVAQVPMEALMASHEKTAPYIFLRRASRASSHLNDASVMRWAR